MPRRAFDPAELDPGAFYQLLNAVVVPRPIAWVSSRSSEGVDNLAPHSYYSVSSVAPPIVQFTSVGRKDSLRNIEATGEFVVCLTPSDLFEQVNATATNFPADEDEYAAVGLEREASDKVAPPRVAASPVALECVLHTTVSFGMSTVVMGRVVQAVVAESVLDGDTPVIERLDPLSRLGGDQWGLTREIKEISRISFDDWPGHYAGS